MLLGAFVFHSRNWDMQAEDNVIAAMRRKMASLCVHEVRTPKLIDSPRLTTIP